MSEFAKPPRTSTSIRVVAAGAIGNVLEWYDFCLYGYMAVIISKLFFPPDIGTVALIATFGTFAAGFLMRPLGAVVFGFLGDTVGRKAVLITSVIAMAVPTTLLGTLPTYEDIGIGATILIVILRLVQGVSVGGEFSGSVTYLAEMAPHNRRAFVACWSNVGGQVGTLLGAGAPAAVIYAIGSDAYGAWGWRLPFLFGGVLGVIALVLRSLIPEPTGAPAPSHSVRTKRPTRHPLIDCFRYEAPVFVKSVLYCMGYGVLFYITLLYLPTWLSLHTSMALHEALLIITLIMIPQSILIPLAALASDRLVRRTYLLAAIYVMVAILAVPLFRIALDGDVWSVTIVVAVFAFLVAFALGISPALLSEAFDRGHRLSGYSLSFNTGIAVGGGAAPMIATWLIHETGNDLAPAYYLMFGTILAATVLLTKRDRSREPLR